MGVDQLELLDTCDKLAAGFAEHAPAHDRAATFPVENFDELRSAGLFGLMVPESHGGMGADFLDYTLAAGRLARGDASTAVAFNMHNIVIGVLAELDVSGIGGRHGKRLNDFRDWAFAEAMAGKLFAASLTEPGAGFHPGSLSTKYRREDDGFVINGKKSFVSMSGHAAYYVVAMVPETQPSGGVPTVSWIVVQASDPGVRIEEMWDTMGMRGTVSNNMYLEDCRVPLDRLFLGIEGLVMQKLAAEPHWVVGGFTACYLGVVEAMYEFVVDYLGAKKMHGTGAPMSENEMLRHRVGEMSVLVEAARELTYAAARRVLDAPGDPATNTAIHRAKYFVGEYGPRIASEAIRICGGTAISKHFPMERFYRDIRCCGLMPAKSDECLWYVGKDAFGYNMADVAETYW